MSIIYWIEINLSYLDLSGTGAFRLKDELEDGLNQLGIGEIIGGGTMLDGSAIDIEFEANSLHTEEKLLEFFRGKELEDYVKIRQG